LNARLFRHRALTFLGDGGSTFLGFTLACLLIEFAQGDEALIEPVTALWFLGLPLIDTLSLMIRRLLRGASPFSADRHHLHHLLCRARLRVNTTLVILLLGHGLLVLIGLAGVWLDVPEPLQFYAFLAVFAGYYVLVSRSSRLMRWLHRARRQIVNGHGILRGLL
jgi:UDP-GlcNAc:undecaprenyl-phosphate GlcNAc-1-phosphate transferase